VNRSIHYQMRRHGEYVSSAFTSLCVLRRQALEAMGGWDDARSARYADDVVTRFLLPRRSMRARADATAIHLKEVHLGGLLKHRYNVGYHFFSSVASHARRLDGLARNLVLDSRYPLATLSAAGTMGSLLLAAPTLGLTLPAAMASMALGLLPHLAFARFVAETGGPARALVALPMSEVEGFCFLFGIAHAAVDRVLERI
jgi:hypothetical protein